jgi:hypothetical protein
MRCDKDRLAFGQDKEAVGQSRFAFLQDGDWQAIGEGASPRCCKQHPPGGLFGKLKGIGGAKLG